MMQYILKVGSLAKTLGGPSHLINKIGLIVYYDSSYEDAFAYCQCQGDNVLCYKVLVDEEREWFSREELECIDAEI